RRSGPQHSPMEGSPHGAHGGPAHGPGVLHGRVQAASRVQLGGRRAPFVPGPGALVHRVPAPLGPAVDLGRDGGDVARRLRAGDRETGPVPAAGRGHGGAEHALALVRAARAGVAIRAGDLPGRPLLADPQGRRNLGAALTMAREELPQDQETFDRVMAEEKAKGTSPRVAEGRARSAAVKAYRA